MAGAVSFAELEGKLENEVCGVQTDSRRIQAGDIFLAVPGETEDGAKYIDDALARGARVIVACKEACQALLGKLPDDVFVCEQEDMREAVARLAQARFHTAHLPLKILGVTGTNGKTTATYLMEALLTALGEKVGVMGTVSYRWPGFSMNAPLTTPDPLVIHENLAKMQKAGCTYCVMEVSSHAILQKRVACLPFAGAAFTNLTQDHLDFHKTMESYFAAKAKLFCELPRADKAMAVNGDDVYGRRLLQMCPQALGFGFAKRDDLSPFLQGEILRQDTQGLSLRMHYQGRSWLLSSPLIGAFNAANLLTVQALALGLGFSEQDFGALGNFCGVRGRLERVEANGRHVFVDYAHTPDALENVLKALRKAGFQRIVALFGCGGNRDRGKRPLMGEAVAKYADVAVLTSDNPRFEDPMAIIEDVLPGLAKAREKYVEADRRLATRLALGLVHDAHDCLLIAGKGHEDYQIIQGKRHHYSDQEVVSELSRADASIGNC